jgi:hypothetical protein
MSLCFATEPFSQKILYVTVFCDKSTYVPTPVAETNVKINKMLHLARYLAPWCLCRHRWDDIGRLRCQLEATMSLTRNRSLPAIKQTSSSFNKNLNGLNVKMFSSTTFSSTTFLSMTFSSMTFLSTTFLSMFLSTTFLSTTFLSTTFLSTTFLSTTFSTTTFLTIFTLKC